MTTPARGRARRSGSAGPGAPERMKAAALGRFGPPSVLTLHELPVPRPRAGEVLIALDTAGVGIWDASIRDGSWRRPGRPRFPLVPDTDGAGQVAAIGARVRGFRPGDRVYAYEFGNRQGGFYAEFAAAEARHVARVPNALDLRSAGALATTGLTALQGLDALGLRRGQTVLVFGASGAVGTIAVQLAARAGARVIATASGPRAARAVQRLGADGVIDARRDDGIDRMRRLLGRGSALRHVLALAGGPELERCLDFVQPRGLVVHPNGVEPAPRPRRTFRVRSYDAVADPGQFAKLARRIGRHGLRVPIAAVYPLARAADAHRRLERGRLVGRIVLRIRGRR